MTERITITLPHHRYDIVIGEPLLNDAGTYIREAIKADRAIIISDNQVARFWLHRLTGALEQAGIRTNTFIIPAGETSKTLEQFSQTVESILEHKPDRQTAIIALGGGVVGDLAGFAASCALRGLPYIQIPTSLLAQVDSSVGGKTGINSRHGKNLIGSFYQPHLVLADIGTLATLPERQRKAGYAEILKYALIGDTAFFDWLDQHGSALLAGDKAALAHAVKTSCKAKAAIVMADEKEKGARALLNFGHTFAHALESETGMNDTLLHGEAVAVGMMLAFETSVAMGICPKSDLTRLQHHYEKVKINASLADVAFTFNAKRLIKKFQHDKKIKGGLPTFILTRGIGQAFIEQKPNMQVISQMLEKACGDV